MPAGRVDRARNQSLPDQSLLTPSCLPLFTIRRNPCNRQEAGKYLPGAIFKCWFRQVRRCEEGGRRGEIEGTDRRQRRGVAAREGWQVPFLFDQLEYRRVVDDVGKDEIRPGVG